MAEGSMKVEWSEGMSDLNKIRCLWTMIQEIKENTTEDLTQT